MPGTSRVRFGAVLALALLLVYSSFPCLVDSLDRLGDRNISLYLSLSAEITVCMQCFIVFIGKDKYNESITD